MFTEIELQKLEEIKSRYPDKKAALMPLLWMLQEKFGWISPDAMRYAGDALGVPHTDVQGVVTFYTMYFDKPMGRHHIQVCTNVSCMLRGGDKIYKDVCAKLGIGHRERTADGKFSVEEVECMGACGGAPMIAVNETFHEQVLSTTVDELISSLV